MSLDLIGYSETAVVEWLTERGLGGSVTYEYSDQPPGVVLDIYPMGDVQVGSLVSVVVSKGQNPTQAPLVPEENPIE